MENVIVSHAGEWYYIILIAVFSTFFGLVSFKLGDTLAAIREIAINTRPKRRKKAAEEEEPFDDSPVDYEEQYPRMLNVKGFLFSTKGLFSIVGLVIIIVGWIPVLIKIKQMLGFN
ncbi:MAG: hypothetical protein GY765_33515 [bacterium]|nr:hypothetical protein [bacterium]